MSQVYELSETALHLFEPIKMVASDERIYFKPINYIFQEHFASFSVLTDFMRENAAIQSINAEYSARLAVI